MASRSGCSTRILQPQQLSQVRAGQWWPSRIFPGAEQAEVLFPIPGLAKLVIQRTSWELFPSCQGELASEGEAWGL